MDTNLQGFKLICKVNIHFVLKKKFLKKCKFNSIYTFIHSNLNCKSASKISYLIQIQEFTWNLKGIHNSVLNSAQHRFLQNRVLRNLRQALWCLSDLSVLGQEWCFKATLPQKVRSFSETAPNKQPADDTINNRNILEIIRPNCTIFIDRVLHQNS